MTGEGSEGLKIHMAYIRRGTIYLLTYVSFRDHREEESR